MRTSCYSCFLAVACGWMVLTGRVSAENWTQFRGPNRDAISTETGLLRSWPEGGPKVLWTTEACVGYSAPAIYDGRVYFNDYNREAKEWLLRCLDLSSGRELWRYVDKKRIRPNHGITRTVPAVDGKYVFSLDPKCVLHCFDAATGNERWRKHLVREYHTTIPAWYAGMCPLIEPDRVIIAPGGDALTVAFDKETGSPIWQTPNPDGHPMTHASVMPAEICGVKQYLHCTMKGPYGVAADDGRLLWFFPWKFNISVPVSPLPIGDDRVFLTSCYEAESVMIRVSRQGDVFKAEKIFKLGPEEWNSETHTPIVYKDHLFAVGKKRRGLFTCLDLDGNQIWTSMGKASFGLGSYILADGMFFILEGKTGILRLLDANVTEYRELASAQVLTGPDVWAPLALSDGKLIVRDMAKVVCLEVGQPTKSEWQWDTMEYRQALVISGKGAEENQFTETLRGIAVDGSGLIYAVGDLDVKVFDGAGKLLRRWRTEQPGYCVAIDDKGDVYVGEVGRIEKFDATGNRLTVLTDEERMGRVTAIGFSGEHLVIADAKDRCLRRYDAQGRWLNNIGKDNRTKGFLVPNGHLDFAIETQGTICAVNPGKHRVERYTVEGKLLNYFGRFGTRKPEDFPGCCNPTNLTLTTQGHVVVTEKAGPRVKVFTADGKLLTVVASDGFDPNCKNMDVAVDSQGRVYVVDTFQLNIHVFAPVEAEDERTVDQPAVPAGDAQP